MERKKGRKQWVLGAACNYLQKLYIYGENSQNRISKKFCNIECDVELRDLISQSEEAVRDLEGALNPMRKKYSSMNPEDQEQFRQKEKLVSLIKDQFDSARSSANNEEYVPRKKPDWLGVARARNMPKGCNIESSVALYSLKKTMHYVWCNEKCLINLYPKLQSLNVKVYKNIKPIRFTLKIQRKNIKL